MRMVLLFSLMACGGSTDPVDPTGESSVSENCEYPTGAVEPMEINEVIFPYSWEKARTLEGFTASLEMEKIPCNSDDDIDWSPFDVLLFVSIPAW